MYVLNFYVRGEAARRSAEFSLIELVVVKLRLWLLSFSGDGSAIEAFVAKVVHLKDVG